MGMPMGTCTLFGLLPGLVAAAVALGAAPVLDIGRVNAMDRAAFLETFGAVFENSPWVAERVLPERPFDSPKALHAAMMAAVRAAPAEERLRFLNAHPELAGAEARQRRMTAHSVAEQGSAGLDGLSEADLARFDRLNAAYRQTFGFPFIIAVRGRTQPEILRTFEHRLENTPEAEQEAALAEIAAITHGRLERILGPFD
ncbi:2-oxo-4-hydroxy-4-carboxy-5-ureidoimidazoline decarboxylase [Methylobacterium sp. sgz302541]|uniref:2-oxo-4-hydroxy-4-carboxy-5-ureidoimidazoline decarboxylase n=1 Tax=unclassified Methylobacterium TaxID=2615210 RepID=UPI003D325623